MIGAGEPERSYRVTRSLPDRARTLLVQGVERCTMEDRRTIVMHVEGRSASIS
jgi:hypothetical protein